MFLVEMREIKSHDIRIILQTPLYEYAEESFD